MNNINKLLKTIDEASAKFNSKLPAIEKKMLGELSLLLKGLEVRNGKIASNIANLKLVNGIKGKLERLILSKEYVKDVADFVRSFSTIANTQNDYFKNYAENWNPKAYQKAIQKSAIDNTINSLTGVGVNANVLQPVMNLLRTAVTSGQSYAKLEETIRKTLTETEERSGSLSRYAKTYTVDSIAQFSGEYMAAITKDLDSEWFVYRGSNIETTREFCLHLTKKEYIHKSEIPEILKGIIDGHKCKIYEATGLPYGLKEGTNSDNFMSNRGGWNCQHQLIPVHESSVPENIRNKFNNPKSIYKKIVDIENEIRLNKSFETAVVFDEDGNMIINKVGDETSVSATPEEIKKMKDGIFTHNHPRGYSYPEGSILRIGNSFSREDIMFAINANVSEIRAVTEYYTFTLKRPENGWPDLRTASLYYSHFNMELRKQFGAVIDKSTNQQLTIDRANTVHYHIVAKNFSKHFGIEYTKQKTR